MKFIFKLCIYFHTKVILSKEAPKEGSSKSSKIVYGSQFSMFTHFNSIVLLIIIISTGGNVPYSRQGGERYHPTAICTEVLT